MDKDYNQLLEDLRTGKIDELVIEPNEFMQFQPIFHSYEYRQQVVGTAMRGGQISYRIVAE